MQVRVSNIEAYVTYSFPLGLLTEADMAKFNELNSRLCKNIHRLPVSAPTAVVFESKNKAGLGLTSLKVKYAQLITKNLVLHLNGKGALGVIIRAMLKLQDSITSLALKDSKGKAGTKATAPYHLVQQLTVIKQASVHLKTPVGQADLRYDPNDMDSAVKFASTCTSRCWSWP